MIVLTYFQLFCSPATTVSNTSNIICFSSNVHIYSDLSDLSDGIRFQPSFGKALSHKPMQGVVLRHKSGFHFIIITS